MRRLVFSVAAALFALLLTPGRTQAQTTPSLVVVTGQTAGPTPFISDLHLTASDVSTIRSVQFEITPKPGSVTRAVSVVYFSDYLQGRGYIDFPNGGIIVPVFGLYADYANTVNLTYRFDDGTSATDSVTVTTPAFTDTYGYGTPTVLQARTSDTSLSYDYFQLKASQGTQSPVILDTDGAIRWVGTSGQVYLSEIFFQNSFYTAYVTPGTVNQTGINRMELDGTNRFLIDYSALGVTSTGAHNIDPGKTGMILSVNTTAQLESVLYEIDTTGNILKTWDLSAIISAAMTAGGDDPTQFVYPAPTDWFHNNSNTYRRSDDSLIVSSRENFVICLDYETGAIKWILGDPTKHWYQFPSLRKYALALASGSLPPIGQHSVSITHDDNLLLFDNGTGSFFQQPPGETRTYSAVRKYHIDTQAMTATELPSVPQDQSIYSRLTSSVYEDDPSNYFIDYANITIDNNPTYAEFRGVNAAGEIDFDYRYPAPSVGAFAWNAIPIHFEDLVFTGPETALAAGHPAFFTGEVALANGVYYLDFPGNGNVFGYYSYLADPGYIYHFGLGYEYVFDAADSQQGVYLYDFASQGFFYTSPRFPFPYLYDFSLGSVVYYNYDPNDSGLQRSFYDFSTSQTIVK